MIRHHVLRIAPAIATLLLVSTAQAHRPTSSDDELRWTIEKPEISYVLAGSFETGEEVFTVELSYDAPFALPFELLTEHRREFEDFRPAYAVVGPGLRTPTEEEREALPREVPEGHGVFVDLNQKPEREAIFESVMRRAYYSSGAVALVLHEGDHEVWIWSPDGDEGDFFLGFGVEEDFSDGGFSSLPKNWDDYAY